ncbi:MAG: translation initiation factor IF-2 N-terminal domain-containing protein, partial [Clostridia bacterium]|nr:translation initiation factor IF-2 N-terminal domain-containing protein [Clostridia bacterium]
MTNKYKLSDLAKDFGLKSKDIIDIISSLTGSEKKSGATLDETEIALVFNKLTLYNQVKSFDDYFATGKAAREKEKQDREDKKNKKLAEQMAILEQLKAAAAAQNGEKVPEEKKEEKKPEPKKVEKKEEPKKAEKKETEAPKKAEKKPEVKKPETPKKEEKKAEPKKEVAKEVKKEEPKKEFKPSDPNPFVSKKKDKTPGAAPNRGPAEIRHVDTRTSNINIDKYNEKYESIAPANAMKDNYSKKQKIKQKSQDYRRPQGAKRETEADKMRRMQLERIKKTPITV